MTDRPAFSRSPFSPFGRSAAPAATSQGDLFGESASAPPPPIRTVQAPESSRASAPAPVRPAIPLRPTGFRSGFGKPLQAIKPAGPVQNAPTLPAAPAPQPAAPAPAAKKSMFSNLAAVPVEEIDDQPGIDLGPMPTPVAPEPVDSGIIEIKCTIKRVIFKADDGFRIYIAKSKTEDFSISINSPVEALDGDKVIVRGEWGTHKGKRTFKGKLLMKEVPSDPKGVVSWLKTGAVHGVGKATGDKLVAHYGDGVLAIMDNADRIMEAGIDRKKAEAIAEAWTTNAMQPELISWLGSLGLGVGTITKIIRRYGMTARNAIERNPWQLAETIDGVGFIKADEIGRNAGHERTSENRIKAGISHVLNEAVNRDGHTGLPRKDLIQRAVKLLNINRDLVDAQIDAALDGNTNLFDPISQLAAPVRINRAEKDLVYHLARLRGGDGVPRDEAEAAIEASQQAMGIKLDPSQREAALLALTNDVSIITGGPGTGKSTTQKVIVHALRSFKKEVMLGAPTGRAAKRLAEVSGLPASTCHRLLQFSAEVGGFTYDASNPFREDWGIIDEFSMVDTTLGASFIQAIDTGSGLTIVGDVDQLPSVGPGQLLRDLIESNIIPTARLTTVHRQGEDSGIIVAAHRINSGLHPVPDDVDGLEGFQIDKVSGPDKTLARVVSLMRDELPALGFDPLKDVQVLASVRNGPVGVKALNDAIKAVLNPVEDDGMSVTLRDKPWTKGDRVMHIRNDYAKNVYNGEVGFVSKAGQRANEETGKLEDFIRVDYSGYEVSYSAKDIDDLEQCWAATVHKSQGCEFPVVIMVCPWEHSHFLSRNLFYTGVTRAKTLCIVVGEDLSIGQAVARADTLRRHTGLPALLRAAMNELEVAALPDDGEDYPEPEDDYPLPTPGGFIQLED